MKRLEKLINEALATLAPSGSQMKLIIGAMENELGVHEVVWKKYLTYTESGENSNKYHYFAVFKNGSSFLAANAAGKIGYRPGSVTDLGTYEDKQEAINSAESKILVKMKKGYDVTPL